jgi:geranylgeranyl pyrophosphate synthase
MDLHKVVSDRLVHALYQNRLDSNYRERILSVSTRFLEAQSRGIDHENCLLCLPYLSCAACGGDTAKVAGVTTSWLLLQMAAYLLDKIEDFELLHATRTEIGVTANLSTGMIFIAEWILNHLELDCVDAGTAWDIQRAFHESVLTVCSGQHRDLSVKAPNLEDCWSIAREKSGAAFGLACYSGARVAVKDTSLLKRMDHFGKSLGVIIQIGDDLEEVSLGVQSIDSIVEKAPIIGAYSKYVKPSILATTGSENSGVHQQEDVLARGSVVYLRLEAIKLAESAKRELDIPDFSADGKSGLLRILCRRPIIRGFIN